LNTFQITKLTSPPARQHFFEKKIRARDDLIKKLSTQAKKIKKIIAQVGNVPSPSFF
jgi:hypothetical protein